MNKEDFMKAIYDTSYAGAKTYWQSIQHAFPTSNAGVNAAKEAAEEACRCMKNALDDSLKDVMGPL